LQPRRCYFDSDELPEDERETFNSLIQSSEILSIASGEYKAGGMAQRDVFSYSLSIINAGVKHVFIFDDVSAPPSVLPLLQFLKEIALKE